MGTCRNSGPAVDDGEICVRPGCGKPTFNGQPGEYCGRRCKAEHEDDKGGGRPMSPMPPPSPAVGGSRMSPAPPAVGSSRMASSKGFCARSGCNKPSWNGQPGENCSKSCKAGLAGGPAAFPVCLRRGCGKPTWNGQPDEYCGKTCKSA